MYSTPQPASLVYNRNWPYLTWLFTRSLVYICEVLFWWNFLLHRLTITSDTYFCHGGNSGAGSLLGQGAGCSCYGGRDWWVLFLLTSFLNLVYLFSLAVILAGLVCSCTFSWWRLYVLVSLSPFASYCFAEGVMDYFFWYLWWVVVLFVLVFILFLVYHVNIYNQESRDQSR